ncbi:polysaccharide biosynthesis tyrosine autokinase [Glaciihabitans sp. UYNi722]|uniref:polysaccharide biosynthesis tyrosine autokinase n=1 Tax=Glaciihabitans sp. UYNi722 TaxID=3156344 RepID=UPI003399466B
MNTNSYVDALRRSWVVLVVLIVLGGLVGFGLSALAKPAYTSSAKIFFAPGFSVSSTDLNQGATYTQSQMLSFAELATSPLVLRQVISDEELDTTPAALATTVDATPPPNTAVLVLSATQATPKKAADVANAVAAQLSAVVEDLAPATTTNRKAISATIFAPAIAPSAPSAPNTWRNLLAGLLIGLVLGVLVVFLRFRLDTRVHSSRELTRITDAALLGTIESTKVTVHSSPHVTESYRKLAGTLSSAIAGSRPALLVASSTHGEGVSEIVIGLAAALAERRRKVLVIDANLRHPVIAERTSLDNSNGLASLLRDIAPAKEREVIQTWDEAGFDVVTSGPSITNPSASLSSPAFAEFLVSCRKRYDVILIDTAPVVETADASILGEISDGVLLVADTTRVKNKQLSDAIDTLDSGAVTVFGVVLNRFRLGTGDNRAAVAATTKPQRQQESDALESV